MSDVLEVSSGQIKVREQIINTNNNKNNLMVRGIVFKAHFWCMQVCEALNEHAHLREPRGLGFSPGGDPPQAEVLKNCCRLLLITADLPPLPLSIHTLSISNISVLSVHLSVVSCIILHLF